MDSWRGMGISPLQSLALSLVSYNKEPTTLALRRIIGLFELYALVQCLSSIRHPSEGNSKLFKFLTSQRYCPVQVALCLPPQTSCLFDAEAAFWTCCSYGKWRISNGIRRKIAIKIPKSPGVSSKTPMKHSETSDRTRTCYSQELGGDSNIKCQPPATSAVSKLQTLLRVDLTHQSLSLFKFALKCLFQIMRLLLIWNSFCHYIIFSNYSKAQMFFLGSNVMAPIFWQPQSHLLTHTGQAPCLYHVPALNSIEPPMEPASVKAQSKHIKTEIIRNDRSTTEISKNDEETRKIRKRKNIGSESEGEEFEAKVESTGPKVTYKKKNTESNIINQTFSYLNSEKSKREALRLLNNDVGKVAEFYRLMEKVKKSSKKYINRKYIKQLLAFEDGTAFLRTFTKAKVTAITPQEVRKTLRILTHHFLRSQIKLSLLTSSKIYKQTLPQHFWRKREIMGFLFGEEQ